MEAVVTGGGEIEAQAAAVNHELFAIGQQFFEDQGFTAEVATRMSTIQMNAGGKCVGTFAEYVAVEDHAQARTRLIDKVKAGVEKGEDPIEVLYDRLDAFVERDENDKVVHAVITPAEGADPKKKVTLRIKPVTPI